jgi:hypothetical protein
MYIKSLLNYLCNYTCNYNLFIYSKVQMFKQTIFSINYYLAKPEVGLDHLYSEFRCAELKQVPVIRIFGATPQG